MDLAATITDVHQRSAKTLLRLQELQSQRQQIDAMLSQAQAELLRLDGEERALVGLKAEARDGE